MKIWIVEWASAVDVPRFDRIHDVLNAFLRASEQGAWAFDATEKNAPFVLHYHRGPWDRSLFGWGRKMIPAPFKRVVSLRPMRLIVELFPSLTQVSLTIRHQLYLRGLGKEQVRTAEEARCSDSVKAERNALAAYLRSDCRRESFADE
jgi:hypothetical protein